MCYSKKNSFRRNLLWYTPHTLPICRRLRAEQQRKFEILSECGGSKRQIPSFVLQKSYKFCPGQVLYRLGHRFVKFQFIALFGSTVGNAVLSVPKRFRGFDAL